MEASKLHAEHHGEIEDEEEEHEHEAHAEHEDA
jgi:hypothetical protein